MAEWRPVLEPPGVFEVSDDGQVRSVDRVYRVRCRWGHEITRRMKGRVRAQTVFSNGYLSVDTQTRAYLVHRLVAATWIPNPDNLPQVNHKNGDRADNRVENLEWMTCGDNHRHSYQKLGRKIHAKTTLVSVGGTKYESQKAAADALGINPGSVHSALNRGHLCLGMEVIKL